MLSYCLQGLLTGKPVQLDVGGLHKWQTCSLSAGPARLWISTLLPAAIASSSAALARGCPQASASTLTSGQRVSVLTQSMYIARQAQTCHSQWQL